MRVDTLPGGESDPATVHRGPEISIDRPTLRSSPAGDPIFDPLPGWSLPDWSEAEEEDLRVQDLVAVRARPRESEWS